VRGRSLNAFRAKFAFVAFRLFVQIRDMVDEELLARPVALMQGVRQLDVAVPRMNYRKMDTREMEYDDKRMCWHCKCVCVLSVVACECSPKAVSCLRHFTEMCKCGVSSKYLIEWVSMDELHELKGAVSACPASARVSMTHGLKRKASCAAVLSPSEGCLV
jgi:hypothetical protein